jgi:aspartyl-tRNA(Asn)/glutamyl-tRNA(Gln) amidotransferase subunit A
MDATDLCYLSAGELGPLLRKKTLSPVEVVEAHLRRIEALEPKLNSFITFLPDRALEEARKAEKEIQAGTYRGPLHGIPLGLKDLYAVQGIPNTGGIKLYQDVLPAIESTVAGRLREAGTILLGKLNLHPLAYGPTGENPEYGPMHNPWNIETITGGSSGGSASAAASGQCTLTMGTDTGGSVRIPGALCGIVGLKPTYGRLSRYGLTTLSWSLDHPGPMVRSVEDCALVTNVTAGPDPKDPGSIEYPVPDFTQALAGKITGLRIGVPREYWEAPVDPGVKEVVWLAIRKLEELGAAVSEVSWPMFHRVAGITSTIQMAEATAYHQKLIRENRDRIWHPVRLRLESGYFISAVDYIQAERARALYVRTCHELMETVDLLAGPTVPVTAFPIGTNEVKIGKETVKAIPLLTQYTRPFNLNGFPAITIPCGFLGGLPVGLQLAGRPFEEDILLRAAYAYEQATDWHLRRPPVS